MNYPIPMKKAFKKIRYSAVDIWQNLRLLKKDIQCLVRNIDNVGACVVRNRRLLQSLDARECQNECGESCESEKAGVWHADTAENRI